MEPTILAAAGLAAVAILLIFAGLASSSSGAAINARLERYAAGRDDTVKGAGQPNLGDMISGSEALQNFNKAVEQRSFGANLARDLARADLRLKVSEFLMIWGTSVVTTPAIFLFASLFLPALGNPIALLVGVLLGAWIPKFWLGRRKSSRLKAFNKQLPDTITLIANALRAGSSFLQAIELVVRESRPPISI